ncbi:hypothetical protein F511_41414 [Dorcoceras hygrometricum]|uniref:Uncharacterized protein n=1 Tax=Dorcoceras hygrometricum TaxID=472368 RepID=A0A2Z7AHL6_9LAMI|nr:hypothetical protein F511_41414 [Dorcoceras hygrometricum]
MSLVFTRTAIQVNFESVLRLPNRGLNGRNTVINTVNGSSVAITKKMFAGFFKLPTEGLVVLSELPDKFVAQMGLEFSESRVPINSSSNPKDMKLEHRFLHDIIAKTLTAKTGPFDVVAQIRFDMMVAIMGGIKINWTKILFRNSKGNGYAIYQAGSRFRCVSGSANEGSPSLLEDFNCQIYWNLSCFGKVSSG